MIKNLVVHCKLEPYDVYIGRGLCPQTGAVSKWANPYSHKNNSKAVYKVKSRAEAISRYKEWVEGNPELLSDLPELKGKILGCWCSPQPCHGWALIELIEKYCK